MIRKTSSKMKEKRGTTILKMSLLNWLPAMILCIGLLSTGIPVQAAQSTPTASTQIANPIPTLAYYYIWYDTSSWNRAKSDYPLLGWYSSDSATVMLQHIQWAKAAGITGFIVSWKGTTKLNSRLDQLVKLADQENFKLAVIYEGLDFNRDPLPVSTVASDLDFFVQHFASDPAFQLFSKPMVIWSGTWMFNTPDIASVTGPLRSKLLILASEKSVDGYLRLAGLVDGDAYYWSSVNPATYPGYQAKLTSMSTSIHKNGGLWIAPAAPGFNAQMIGGTSVVERNNGDTFMTEINTALASSPDALGIISWNEFSENSHIEPSQAYGMQYLNILSSINHLPAPAIGEFDSSLPSGVFPEVIPFSRQIAIGGISFLAIVGAIVITIRRIRM
jgi:hypothetical protein